MRETIDVRAVKGEAKALLRTARESPFRITLLYIAAMLLLSLVSAVSDHFFGKDIGPVSGMTFRFSFLSILAGLISLVMLTGYQWYCLRAHRGETAGVESILDAFFLAGRVVLLEIVMNGVILLGFSVFVLPGFYFALSYALSPLILCDDPAANPLQALRRSRRLMNGHKLELALLVLSFWPLLLLLVILLSASEAVLWPLFPNTLAGGLAGVVCESVLTAGVRIYLQPYLGLALAGFYRRVTERGDALPEDTGL